ncbi:hypothetical protein [Streptomyces goshikiensis]
MIEDADATAAELLARAADDYRRAQADRDAQTARAATWGTA